MQVRLHRWGKRPYIDVQLLTHGRVDCTAFVEKGPSRSPHETVWLVSKTRAHGAAIERDLVHILSHESLHFTLEDVVGDLASNSYDRISNSADRRRRGRRWSVYGF